MAHAYTPGLTVTHHMRHRCRRILPMNGEVVVEQGQRVGARDIVAQTSLPGDVTPINLAHLLALPPAEVAECILKKEGDRVEIGEPLARTKGIFGLFSSEYKSTVAGTLESISHVTGQLILRGEPQPIQVLAYLAGNVVELFPGEGIMIEADVAYVQGIFGIGGEAYGPIRMASNNADQVVDASHIQPDMQGKVVVGGARMTGDAIRTAIEVGASALVAGGIDDQDLREILGYDLGVAITGSEQIGITLIITEGFGDIGMAGATFQLLSSHEGDEASVSGATQIRAGVVRPDIVIPLDASSLPEKSGVTQHEGVLGVGTQIRLIREPNFGQIGTVTDLPTEPHLLDSGSRARVLTVQLGSGVSVTVPRANVETLMD